VCTPGQDQTCNEDPTVSALYGHCNQDGTCSCNAPFVKNGATGKCIVAPDVATCGNAAVMAKYETCKKATDQTSCETAGGAWGSVGLYPQEICVCSTGQGDCSCKSANDCMAGCIAQPTGGAMECNGVVEGKCASGSPFAGCWCIFDADGTVSGRCID
jgi:hypothetical protein